jgi:hypothetical protein
MVVRLPLLGVVLRACLDVQLSRSPARATNLHGKAARVNTNRQDSLLAIDAMTPKLFAAEP